MTGRKWKPGDVALRTGCDGAQTLSLVVQVRRGFGDCEVAHGYGPHWHHANGGWNQIPDDPKWGTYRPLVVIDPDSPEDQRHLLRLLRNSGAFRGVVAGGVALDCLGDALREFADPKPPKPDEPTGLGAVVEDIHYRPWVRVQTAEDWEPGWYGLCDPDATVAHYADIDAVRVLSEGVQS